MLNGSPVFLTGFDRHEDSPRTGMCPDEETVRQDLLEMKRAGANFVRLCHYPHDSGELDLCDELGLLVMAEIPLYWWNGLEEGPENCERKLAAAKRQLVGMIRRDINHPSVIFWSVSNETDERRPEVAEGNQELVRLAKATDDSRLAVHVSHCWPVCPHFEADDVLCVNAYPSWSAAIAGRPQGDVATATQFWRAHLEQLHRTYPNKPILVTEFGHPALEGVFGCSVGEDRQAQVLEAEFAGMSAPYVCGAVVWCYADHPWPEEDFIRYLTTSPYGLVTRERRPRRAFSVVSKLFRQKQSTVGPPPWQQVHPDGAPVEMVRHHMGDIPLVPFPEGFAIRPMRPGEVGLWTDIQRDAEPYLHISDDVFSREFGGDLQATQWRCFFVVNARGVAVGTVSAWYWHDPDGQEYGRLHWLAVRPSYQGKGLGKAALSYALRRLAEWHSRCMLITSAKRLRAIKMYLDFGFEPWLTDDEARVAWCQVFEALKAGES